MYTNERKLQESSHPHFKPNNMEKSFRIDDLLQRKTKSGCTNSSGSSGRSESRSEIEDLCSKSRRQCFSDDSFIRVTETEDGERYYHNNNNNHILLKEKIFPKRRNMSPTSMTVSTEEHHRSSSNLEICRNGSRSSSVTTDVGSPSDIPLITSPLSAFSIPQHFYENSQHFSTPLQLQLNTGLYGMGMHGVNTSSPPALIPHPYVSSNSNLGTGVGSRHNWNSSVGNNNENPVPVGLSHLSLFPNLIIPSSHHPHHHLLMHPNQHPGVNSSFWSQPFLANPYVDPQTSDRNHHHTHAFLNRLASSYGVAYSPGRSINPLLNIGSKRKGGQIRFSNSQTAQLEKAFFQHKYLNANDRKKLAHSLALSDRQVKTWFQNRRAKWRKCKDEKEGGSPFDEQNVHHSDESYSPESHYDEPSKNGETSQTYQSSSHA